jgi:ComF family protein
MHHIYTCIHFLYDCIFPRRKESLRVQALTYISLPWKESREKIGTVSITTLASYTHPAMQLLITELKFHKDMHAAMLISQKLEEILERKIAANENLICIPLPLHVSRERTRGYNQVSLVLGCITKRKPHYATTISTQLLTRTKNTNVQSSLSKKDRIINVADAFHAHASVAGKSFILIDDVCTTGATLSAAADALYAGGAQHVEAIAFTRA